MNSNRNGWFMPWTPLARTKVRKKRAMKSLIQVKIDAAGALDQATMLVVHRMSYAQMGSVLETWFNEGDITQLLRDPVVPAGRQAITSKAQQEWWAALIGEMLDAEGQS